MGNTRIFSRAIKVNLIQSQLENMWASRKLMWMRVMSRIMTPIENWFYLKSRVCQKVSLIHWRHPWRKLNHPDLKNLLKFIRIVILLRILKVGLESMTNWKICRKIQSMILRKYIIQQESGWLKTYLNSILLRCKEIISRLWAVIKIANY